MYMKSYAPSHRGDVKNCVHRKYTCSMTPGIIQLWQCDRRFMKINVIKRVKM